MAEYLSLSIEIQVGGAWVDYTECVIGTIDVEAGISGWGFEDRVASTGSLKFRMINFELGYNNGNLEYTVAGYKKGSQIRFVAFHKGKRKCVFYGRIADIQYTFLIGRWYCDIVAVDYMDQLSMHEMYLPAFTTNKRMDEIVPLILANLPVMPTGVVYNTTQDTFPTVFDTIKTKARAIQELQKLALSEMGYIYVTQTATADETLVVEGRATRKTVNYKIATIPVDETSKLLTEAGVVLECENGDDILLEATFGAGGYMDVTFPQNYIDYNVAFGKHHFNDVTCTSYPRKTDTGASTVLWYLDDPIELAAGATIDLYARYRDPDNLATKIGGINMVTPVATTDYLMNTVEGGGGVDVTASLAVTTAFGSEGVFFSLKNNSGGLAYVNKLQCRGDGVYTYNPVESTAKNAALITQEGVISLNYDMKYHSNALVARDFATIILNFAQSVYGFPESIRYSPNRNAESMGNFMSICVGDKVVINAIDGLSSGGYFIHGIKYSFTPGGVVSATYLLKSGLFDAYTAWILNSSLLDTGTVLGY